MKCLGNRFDRIELFVLPALEEVEALATRKWWVPRYYRIEEDVIELANLTCVFNRVGRRQIRGTVKFRTFIDVYV